MRSAMAPQDVQPSLYDEIQREPPKPHKRVRSVSVEGYRQIRAKAETNEDREALFLRCLGAFRNRYQAWPTLTELTRFGKRRGYLVRNDPGLFRPRATDLVRKGVCHYGERRECQVSGSMAREIEIREIGSQVNR